MSINIDVAEQIIRDGRFKELKREDYSVGQWFALCRIQKDLFPTPMIGVLLKSGKELRLVGQYEAFLKASLDRPKGQNACTAGNDSWMLVWDEVAFSWDATDGRDLVHRSP